MSLKGIERTVCTVMESYEKDPEGFIDKTSKNMPGGFDDTFCGDCLHQSGGPISVSAADGGYVSVKGKTYNACGESDVLRSA